MKRATLFATALTLLLLPAEALARAGGGLSGFGRSFGRGGGGGLGRGFGHGHFFFIPVGGGGGGVILALIVIAVLVFFVLPKIMVWWRGRSTAGMAERRKLLKRQSRVETAAAEAAEDDPAFAPDVVKPAATKLFRDIQRAWDGGDRISLRRLAGPDLLAEWERRLDGLEQRGWRNRVEVIGTPHVHYVGLRNVADDSGDRVVVRIEATMRDYVEDRLGNHIRRADALGEVSHVREYWTLGKKGDSQWRLLSIEQGAEGEHALTDEIVASPWADEQAMRDEALVEGAVADAAPPHADVAELADLNFDGDARAAANDLSVADGRFAPAVLEVAARRAVQAWAEAVDGEDTALNQIAHPDAAAQLLHPGDPSRQTRVVVRGPQIRQIRITDLEAASKPPTMTIEVDLRGRRYIEDRTTAAVVSGSQSRASDFTERWTMTLDGDEQQPWRIASVSSSLARR